MSTLNATNQDLEGLEKTTFFRTFFFSKGNRRDKWTKPDASRLKVSFESMPLRPAKKAWDWPSRFKTFA